MNELTTQDHMTEPNSAPELRKCPFCGSSGRVFRYEYDDEAPFSTPFSQVACSGGDCGGSTIGFDTDAEAIAAWNTRPPAQDREALEQEVVQLRAESDEDDQSIKEWVRKHGALQQRIEALEEALWEKERYAAEQFRETHEPFWSAEKHAYADAAMQVKALLNQDALANTDNETEVSDAK